MKDNYWWDPCHEHAGLILFYLFLNQVSPNSNQKFLLFGRKMIGYGDT